MTACLPDLLLKLEKVFDDLRDEVILVYAKISIVPLKPVAVAVTGAAVADATCRTGLVLATASMRTRRLLITPLMASMFALPYAVLADAQLTHSDNCF
jgi:hypothetical protein